MEAFRQITDTSTADTLNLRLLLNIQLFLIHKGKDYDGQIALVDTVL